MELTVPEFEEGGTGVGVGGGGQEVGAADAL